MFQLLIANAPGALCLFAVCKCICHKFTRLNFGIELDDSHHQFLVSILQGWTMHDGSSLEVRPLQYIRVDWLIQIGYTSFQGLFRLVAPGKRETWTSSEDEVVRFWDFFLQRSEWRRGERLQSTPKWTWTTCAEKDESSLALHRYYVFRTPYRLVDKNEAKGNAKQQWLVSDKMSIW